MSSSVLRQEEYANLARRENFYWWNIGRRLILNSVLKRHNKAKGGLILDVGCGSGGNILFLKNFGEVVGLDASDKALSFCKNKGFRELVLEDVQNNISYPDNYFNLVSAFDVLEHLPDDIGALEEMSRVCSPGGLIFITVPAWPFLWSPHDEYLGHQRRYTKKKLKEDFVSLGLNVLETSYFVMPAIPFIVTRRYIEKISKKNAQPHSFDMILPSWLNSILIGWLKLERLLLNLFPLAFGSSLYVIARKK